MSDAQFIPKLVEIAGKVGSLDDAQKIAAADINRMEGRKYYPTNSCAITQYALFKDAGIDLGEPIYLALAFVQTLQKRGWKSIDPADVRSGKEELQPGDIGTTVFGGVRHPGVDHVYLVVKPLSEDENLIADNQATEPHFRYIDGTGGKSPTTLFLRAV